MQTTAKSKITTYARSYGTQPVLVRKPKTATLPLAIKPKQAEEGMEKTLNAKSAANTSICKGMTMKQASQCLSLPLEQRIAACRAGLMRKALNLTRHYEEAEDLVSDTLLQGLLKLDCYHEQQHLFSWLYTIMMNKWKMKIRRPRVVVAETNRTPEQAAHPEADALMADAQFALAMKQLPPKVQVPMQLYYNGYSYEEIATELDLSPNTLKAQMKSARRIWKQSMNRRDLMSA